MKLTTKRNRWYFWRKLFSYMIPMILIVGTVDVFYHFMQCPLHPERSAPCSVNWILAAIYGVFLIITIILAIVTAKMLRKVKKQIENEFLETTKQNKKVVEDNVEIKEKSEEKSEDKEDEIIVDKIKIERKFKPKKTTIGSNTISKNKSKTK